MLPSHPATFSLTYVAQLFVVLMHAPAFCANRYWVPPPKKTLKSMPHIHPDTRLHQPM